MFDEIILKKAEYESTLEIFRRLHSIEIKPRYDDKEENFLRSRDDSPSSFPLSNKKILKMVGTSEEISQDGHRYTSVVFDEHCGEYADEHLRPLSTTTSVRSEVIGNKSISLIFDDQSSELDTSSESVSTTSSRHSDGSPGPRRVSVIFDEHNSSVSSRCVSADSCTVDVIEEEDIDACAEDDINAEDISMSVLEDVRIILRTTVSGDASTNHTDGTEDEKNNNAACEGNIGCIGTRVDINSDIGLVEDNNNDIEAKENNKSDTEVGADNNSHTVASVGNNSYTVTSVANNSDIGLVLGNISDIIDAREYNKIDICTAIDNNNNIDTREDSNSNIDLRDIILAPSGGVELLQSEEYLRNIDTPVLINILNQLASGQHDELLPDAEIAVNDTGTANVTLDELLPLDSEITVDYIDTPDITVDELIRLDNEITVDLEDRDTTDVTVDDSLDIVDMGMGLEKPTSPTSCIIIPPTDQLSVFTEANIKPESPVQEASSGTLVGDGENCGGHMQCQLIQELRDIKQNLSSLHEAIIMSSTEELANAEDDDNVDSNKETLHKNNHNEQNLPTGGSNMSLVLTLVEERCALHRNVDISNSDCNSVNSVDSFEEEIIPSYKIQGKFIPRMEMINATTTCDLDPNMTYDVKEETEFNENTTESVCEEDLDTTMYERNYIFENNTVGTRRRQKMLKHIKKTRNSGGNTNALSSDVRDELAVGDYRIVNLERPVVEEVKTRIIRFVEIEANTECTCDSETQLCENVDVCIKKKENIEDEKENRSEHNSNKGNNENKTSKHNNNKITNIDNNNDVNAVQEVNDYANIYLKEYIFEKDMKTLEEEYLRITQLMDALQVHAETCVTLPTDETIPENDLVCLDKSKQDAVDGSMCSVTRDSMIFENDVREINEGLKQVGMLADPFEIVLNDITCNPTTTQFLRTKLKSMSLERDINSPVNSGRVKILSDVITEVDIRSVPKESNEIAILVQDYLSRLREYSPSSFAKDTASESSVSKDTASESNEEHKKVVTENIEYSTGDDDVFMEPSVSCEISVPNPPEQRLRFDSDIEEINKEMQNFRSQEDSEDADPDMTFTKEELSILRQCIFNKNTNNMKNDAINNSSEGLMRNLINAMDVSVEKNVFDNDVQKINEEMRRISWTPDIVAAQSSFSPLSQSSFENDCNASAHASTSENSNSVTSHVQNIHEQESDTSKTLCDGENSCYETSDTFTVEKKVDEVMQNGDIYAPSFAEDKETTKPNQFHNDTERTSIESNVIYTCKDSMPTSYITSEPENTVSDVKYLQLEDNVFAGKENDKQDGESDAPNMTSEVQMGNRKMHGGVSVEDTSLESKEEEEEEEESRDTPSSSSTNTCEHEETRERARSISKLTIVIDNEKNKLTNGSYGGSDSYSSDKCPSSIMDSSFDFNTNSSLEDIIEQLLTIGGTEKEPLGTPSYKDGTDTMFIELPKSVKSKPKSVNTLKDNYLPNSNPYLPNNNDTNRKVTLELSSSGYLPDEVEIDPYMSSMQIRAPARTQNVVSIEMSSSGSIREDDDIDNYFSFEPFNLKSLGVT